MFLEFLPIAIPYINNDNDDHNDDDVFFLPAANANKNEHPPKKITTPILTYPSFN